MSDNQKPKSMEEKIKPEELRCPTCDSYIARKLSKNDPAIKALINQTIDTLIERAKEKLKPVIIQCPKCESFQAAIEDNSTSPFPTFIHECTNCGYIVMESEWETIELNKLAEEAKGETK